MAIAGGLHGTTHPIHYGGVLRQTAFTDFTPADQVFTVRRDEFLHPTDEVALQLALAFQSFLLHAGLALRTFLPIVHRHLVATDMDVFTREEFTNLRQDVFDKREGRIVARAIDAVENSSGKVGGERPAGTTELWISHQRGGGMAWHFDLRHDGNVPCPGVGHNFANIRLRVIAAVTSVGAIGRARFWIKLEADFLPPRADLGQPWILFDFNAPTLVVRQMPVKGIQLVQGHDVENLLDLLFVEEVPADIQHQPAPLEPRLVLDMDAGECPNHTPNGIRGEHLDRQQLQQRLHTIEDARRIRRSYDCRIRSDGQLIAFRTQTGAGVPGGQSNIVFGGIRFSGGADLELVTRGLE